MALDCQKELMKKHAYWPMVSDLVNLFSQPDVAFQLVADRALLRCWLRIISVCQGTAR